MPIAGAPEQVISEGADYAGLPPLMQVEEGEPSDETCRVTSGSILSGRRAVLALQSVG